MLEENGVYQIESSTAHAEIANIHKDILKNIKEIKTIEINQTDDLSSSALISLLKTIKSNNPDINIPLIDTKEGNIKGVGKFVIIGKDSITN